MMNAKVVIILCCLTLDICPPVFSQGKNADGQSADSVLVKRQRFKKVGNCMAAYRQLCVLADSTRWITDASMQAFEELFESNAIVVNDLAVEGPYPMPMRDYVSMAYNYLDSIGVEALITENRFAEIPPEKYPFIEQDNDGEKIFLYDLPVTKSLMNGIDKSGKIVVFDFPKEYRIIVSIHYYAETGKTLIGKIILDEDEKD